MSQTVQFNEHRIYILKDLKQNYNPKFIESYLAHLNRGFIIDDSTDGEDYVSEFINNEGGKDKVDENNIDQDLKHTSGVGKKKIEGKLKSGTMSEVITKNNPNQVNNNNSPNTTIGYSNKNINNSSNSNLISNRNKENDINIDFINGNHLNINSNINSNNSLSYNQNYELNNLNAALKKDKDKEKEKSKTTFDQLINSHTIQLSKQDKTSFINADFLDRSELRQITNISKNINNPHNKNNSQTFDLNFINSFNNNNYNLQSASDDPNLSLIPKSGKFNSLKLSETVNSHVEYIPIRSGKSNVLVTGIKEINTNFMFDIYNNINEKQDVVIGLQIDNLHLSNNNNCNGNCIGEDSLNKDVINPSIINKQGINNKFTFQSKKVKNKSSSNVTGGGGDSYNRDNQQLSDDEYDKLQLTYEHTCKSLDKQTCQDQVSRYYVQYKNINSINNGSLMPHDLMCINKLNQKLLTEYKHKRISQHEFRKVWIKSIMLKIVYQFNPYQFKNYSKIYDSSDLLNLYKDDELNHLKINKLNNQQIDFLIQEVNKHKLKTSIMNQILDQIKKHYLKYIISDLGANVCEQLIEDMDDIHYSKLLFIDFIEMQNEKENNISLIFVINKILDILSDQQQAIEFILKINNNYLIQSDMYLFEQYISDPTFNKQIFNNYFSYNTEVDKIQLKDNQTIHLPRLTKLQTKNTVMSSDNTLTKMNADWTSIAQTELLNPNINVRITFDFFALFKDELNLIVGLLMGHDSVINDFMSVVKQGVVSKFIEDNVIGLWSGGKGYNLDTIEQEWINENQSQLVMDVNFKNLTIDLVINDRIVSRGNLNPADDTCQRLAIFNNKEMRVIIKDLMQQV